MPRHTYPCWSLICLVLTLVLGPLACNNDDGGGDGGGGIGSNEESTAKGIVSDVVIPIARYVYLDSYVGSLGASSGPNLAACQPLSICSTGSAQICGTQTGAQLTFTSCAVGGVTAQGSIDLQGTSGGGTAALNLTLNGIALEGSVTYTDNGTCFEEVFHSLNGTGDTFTLGLDGILRWCSPSTVNGIIVPTEGVLDFTIPEKGWIVEIMIIPDGAPAEVAVGVYNLQRTQIYLACSGTLFNLDCFVP